MVKLYAGYCEYLNECISDLNKEYEEIALIKGALNLKINSLTFFLNMLNDRLSDCLVEFGEKWMLTY